MFASLKKKIENYNTTKALTTEFTVYDVYGNCTAYKVSGDGVKTIIYNQVYDATKRFIEKIYTSPAASTEARFTYDTWGNVLTETDATQPSNFLITTHAYNGWGMRTSTTMPDGVKTTYHTGWNNNTNKRYFTLVQGKGQAWVKTWYDRAGRETLVETVGVKDMSITKTNTYNTKGKLTQTVNKQGSLTITDTYGYDLRGRLTSQSSTSGQSATYSYGNRSQTTTTNGRNYTNTFDAWGNIKASTDPISLVSYLYHATGQPKKITTSGAVFNMEYDEQGRQKKLIDPNAGTTTFTYDAAGRLKTQTDESSNLTTMYYDRFGRDSCMVQGGVTTKYTYGTSGYNFQRLIKVETGSYNDAYTYDSKGRLNTQTRTIPGESALTFTHIYNSQNGLLQTSTYPGSVQVSNTYDAYGNLVKVQAASQTVWELTGATGTTTTTQLSGGTMTATRTHSSQGLLTNLKTMKSSTTIRDMLFVFNAATGNLTSRTGMMDSQTENFEYDNLDRLTTIKYGTTVNMTTAFAPNGQNGNIQNKTGLGAYNYGANNTGPHVLTGVENTGGLLNTRKQTITYNAFNKANILVDTVSNDAYRLEIFYGADQQRWKTELKKNNTLTKKIIFAGNYEEVTENGITQKIIYLPGGGIYIKQAGQSDKIYYTHKDHLGSVIKITDNTGLEYFKASYDAWGKQTITTNTFKFHRGYTGHEHLPEFGLINMNGRMYDPIVGRFLSPDPYVQMPGYSQSYNRYAYCLNNPLIYTDPDGEFIWFVAIGAVIGSYIGSSIAAGDGGLKGATWNPGKWGGTDWWKGAIIGGIAGAGLGAMAAVGFGGAGTMSMMYTGTGGSTLGWSMTSSALMSANMNMAFTAITSGGNLDAMWKSGVSGLVSGAISGGVQNLVYQPYHNQIGFWKGFGIHGGVGGVTSLVDGAIQGKTGWDLAEYAGWGALKQGLIGGVTDGLRSRIEGKSFWTGEDKRIDLGNGCYRNIHRDPLTIGKKDFTAAVFLPVEIGNKRITVPIGFGWDFTSGSAWNNVYTNIFTGKKQYANTWYNFPILIPFIPFIQNR